MSKKLMMNNKNNTITPIISVYGQSEAYKNSINLIKQDVSTVKFNVSNLNKDFYLSYADFCKVTYDGVNKLNLIFSNWDNGNLRRGQIQYIDNTNYYIVATQSQNNFTDFVVYIEDEIAFKGSYNVQTQPSYGLSLSGCYINALEVYDENIKL